MTPFTIERNTDQLGTPRMVFDKTGSLANTKRHDYLPFGEELIAGQGGRTSTQGYTTDSVRQKFTQKERDNETGLDYSINTAPLKKGILDSSLLTLGIVLNIVRPYSTG